MAQYIHLFETEADYNAMRNGSDYIEPWVSYTEEADRVDYNKVKENFVEMPLTFEILSNGTIMWGTDWSGGDPRPIEYKLNNGEWIEINTAAISDETSEPQINVVTGDIVQFRGNHSTYKLYEDQAKFVANCNFNIKGNIMSMIDSENFASLTSFVADNDDAFYKFFAINRGLISAENLILPATILAEGCYREMFRNCTSLTQAPTLPATTLANYCYGYMFQGCTSLTTAPELPATTLATMCYYSMFISCSSLNYIKCLATDILASNQNCLYDWVSGVASTGTFVKDSTMTGFPTGNNGIPTNWTVEDVIV